MAWEKRQNGGFYYYRSCKVGSTVKKEYLGNGPLAEAAAESDAVVREERLREREAEARALRLLEEDAEATEHPMTAMDDLCELVVQAELERAGFHIHHGQWRRHQDDKAKEHQES
jgi:hypothetical protein